MNSCDFPFIKQELCRVVHG